MNEIVLATAMRILGVRDHSRAELRDKLLKKYPDDEQEIEQILIRLEESKIIDDERFANEYLHYLTYTNPKGILSLQQALRKKGIAEKLISEALASVVPNQELVAKELAMRKLRMLPVGLDNRKKQEKIYRFLVSKGFSFDIARKTIDAVTKDGHEKGDELG